ncbi:carboxylic acid transporter [Vararia minispora EC-137]|uniref:Carboxylic acid transporter n=1 Tax=Vararia minispora EC-137 TaxID=1314806 RepID=A0ACB8QHM9_9AGAM|nr:carboxylic acid transporter [Vararia minispora EC-137]
MAPYFIHNLIPRRQACQEGRPLLVALRGITLLQYSMFFSGWIAWTVDAIDFFSVSLSITNLQHTFNLTDPADITSSITLTLLFRPIGAVIFGILSDRFGRKWPLVGNLLLVASLSLATSFTRTFHQFLAVRSLFGVAMGGIWGLAAATALENLPSEVHGLASGVLQQGYAIGYLVSAIVNLRLVPESSAGWRTMFWTSSSIAFFAAAFRSALPESRIFVFAKQAELTQGTSAGNKSKVFLHETWVMLKTHWILAIYSVLLMTGFNFLSHGSQDLYPTYLKVSKGFSDYHATVATIISNCGAVAGGTIAGLVSQYIGRRLTIILFIMLIGVFIPLWILPFTFSALSAGAFWIQFGVQGAWGVVPIQLSEISPPAFRATFPGVAYQLGNMISSASAQIEATGAHHLRKMVAQNGVLISVPDYATVQGILIGAVAAFVVFITIVGPE